MEHSPAVCLRLIDDFAHTTNDHCSLCLFFGSADNGSPFSSHCAHKPTTSNLYRSPTPGARSDLTFHTAVSWRSDGTSSTSTPSTTSSTATLRAAIPPLRRKSSPTHISLRDLEGEHARWNDERQRQLQQQFVLQLLHEQQSEEELRRVYERQMAGYLEGGYASWGEEGYVGQRFESGLEREWDRSGGSGQQQYRQQRWTTLTPVPELDVDLDFEVTPPAVPPRAPGRRSREVRF